MLQAKVQRQSWGGQTLPRFLSIHIHRKHMRYAFLRLQRPGYGCRAQRVYGTKVSMHWHRVDLPLIHHYRCGAIYIRDSEKVTILVDTQGLFVFGDCLGLVTEHADLTRPTWLLPAHAPTHPPNKLSSGPASREALSNTCRTAVPIIVSVAGRVPPYLWTSRGVTSRNNMHARVHAQQYFTAAKRSQLFICSVYSICYKAPLLTAQSPPTVPRSHLNLFDFFGCNSLA